jgi:hypothetical protein
MFKIEEKSSNLIDGNLLFLDQGTEKCCSGAAILNAGSFAVAY